MLFRKYRTLVLNHYIFLIISNIPHSSLFESFFVWLKQKYINLYNKLELVIFNG